MLKKLTHLAILDNRAIISMKGKEIYEILQGITTNDIRLLKQSQNTVFMNTNGRVISEAILHKPQIQKQGQWTYLNDEVWLDIDQNLKSTLIQHIKKFLIRKKVEINDYQGQLHVYQLYNEGQNHRSEPEGEPIPDPNNDLSEEDDYRNLVSIDPRSSSMGVRVVTNEMPDFDEKEIQTETREHYDLFRYQKGIFEGKEVENRIPFLVNLDFWNAINQQKGCYVGQELTARAYHTGVIRKRMIPFRIVSNDNQMNLSDAKIFAENDLEIGKVTISKGNLGIAAVNYLEIDLNKEFQVENKAIQFILTDTLKTKLSEYITFVQQKQL